MNSVSERIKNDKHKKWKKKIKKRTEEEDKEQNISPAALKLNLWSFKLTSKLLSEKNGRKQYYRVQEKIDQD